MEEKTCYGCRGIQELEVEYATGEQVWRCLRCGTRVKRYRHEASLVPDGCPKCGDKRVTAHETHDGDYYIVCPTCLKGRLLSSIRAGKII